MLSVSLLAGSVYSSEISISWNNVDNYADIRPSEESRKSFQERFFKNMEKYVAKLSNKLPEGYVLKLEINDVDLAGEVRFQSTRQVRVVKILYFPRLNFSYELLDANDHKVKSGEVELKDMMFLDNLRSTLHSTSFGYEKYMLTEWFKLTFKEEIKQNIS